MDTGNPLKDTTRTIIRRLCGGLADLLVQMSDEVISRVQEQARPPAEGSREPAPAAPPYGFSSYGGTVPQPPPAEKTPHAPEHAPPPAAAPQVPFNPHLGGARGRRRRTAPKGSMTVFKDRLMRAMLRELTDRDCDVRRSDLFEALYPKFEAETYQIWQGLRDEPKNVRTTKWEKLASWMGMRLTLIGWIKSNKADGLDWGKWRVTQAGRDALAKFTETPQLISEARHLDREACEKKLAEKLSRLPTPQPRQREAETDLPDLPRDWVDEEY